MFSAFENSLFQKPELEDPYAVQFLFLQCDLIRLTECRKEAFEDWLNFFNGSYFFGKFPEK